MYINGNPTIYTSFKLDTSVNIEYQGLLQFIILVGKSIRTNDRKLEHIFALVKGLGKIKLADCGAGAGGYIGFTCC